MPFTFQDLYDNPLAVARQYALFVAGSADSREKTLTGDRSKTLAFRQVYAGREVFARVVKETAQSVTINVAPGEQAPDSVRAYYLPWARQTSFRITPKGQVGGNAPDGNLFFTANLDGCLVTIAGSAEVPTVYHSNHAGLTLPEGVDESLENPFKIRSMTRNVHAFGKVPPKVNRVDESPQMPRVQTFGFLDYDRGSKQSQVDQYYFKQLSYGTVFGVRRDGEWTFFKQSVQVKEVIDLDTMHKTQMIWVEFAERLWPTETGEPGVHRV